MQNLDHLNGGALGSMGKSSTVQLPAPTASIQAIPSSAATGLNAPPERAPVQPPPLPLMQPSVPAPPECPSTQQQPTIPPQLDRPTTPPPPQLQPQGQQISDPLPTHDTQQITRSERVVRPPQRFKDFVPS